MALGILYQILHKYTMYRLQTSVRKLAKMKLLSQITCKGLFKQNIKFVQKYTCTGV